MSNDTSYRCLQCGSEHGEPAPNGAENWYWKLREFGRVGPLCSEECAARFSHSPDKEPRFSVAEFAVFEKLRGRLTAADDMKPESVAEFRSSLRRDGPDGEPIKVDGQVVWDYALTYREVES